MNLSVDEMRQVHLADALWGVIVDSYNQGGKTRVEIPAIKVVEVLMSLAANVISQMPEARERERILREIPPRMLSVIDAVRARPDFHLPSKSRLILPN